MTGRESPDALAAAAGQSGSLFVAASAASAGHHA